MTGTTRGTMKIELQEFKTIRIKYQAKKKRVCQYCNRPLTDYDTSEFCQACTQKQGNLKRRQRMAAELYRPIGRIYYKTTDARCQGGTIIGSQECWDCKNCYGKNDVDDNRHWVDCKALVVIESIVGIDETCYSDLKMTCCGNHILTLEERDRDLEELAYWNIIELLVRKYGRNRARKIISKHSIESLKLSFAEST